MKPGEAELPMLCEAYHQRVAEIFNNLQLAALGRVLEASLIEPSLASVFHFCYSLFVFALITPSILLNYVKLPIL